jgi:UPF0755 protein
MYSNYKNNGFISPRFVIAIFLFVIFSLFIAYFFYGLQPSFAINYPVNMVIEKGESFKSISARLSEAKIIKSVAVFKLYSILTGSATNFQPGVYKFASTMSVPEIVGYLLSGGKNDVTVQIIEGSTLKDIDRVLSLEGVIKEGDLVSFNFQHLTAKYKFINGLNSLEGFLFPDTYNFKLRSSPEEVVVKMLDNFEKKIWQKLSVEEDWYKKLILASYLEKEVKEFEDMQKVAGILLKRIKIGMPLQVDATLSYAKCEGRFLTCENPAVYAADKEMNSTFNTYKNVGFTSTPISNPGERAVSAAISPKESSYLYYCTSKKNGETIFSKSLDDHNRKCFL